jgi:hypothetical protein
MNWVLGIVGLGPADNSFPNTLTGAGITASNKFAICLGTGDGLLTLGGVDTSIHKAANIQYVSIPWVPSTGPKSWNAKPNFRVEVLQISFSDQSTGKLSPILNDNAFSFLSKGDGTIIDSASTNTYLPSAFGTIFRTAFYGISGVPIVANKPVSIRPDQLAAIPNVVFTLRGKGVNASNVNITILWSQLVEKAEEEGKYYLRILFTEVNGAVLGQNFMNGYVIFFHPASFEYLI